MPVKLEAPVFCFPEALVLDHHLLVRALVKFFYDTQFPRIPRAPQRVRAHDGRRSQLAHCIRLKSGFLTDLKQSSVVRLGL